MSEFRAFLPTAPEAIKPILGCLDHGKSVRAKGLVGELGLYVVKDALDKTQPPLRSLRRYPELREMHPKVRHKKMQAVLQPKLKWSFREEHVRQFTITQREGRGYFRRLDDILLETGAYQGLGNEALELVQKGKGVEFKSPASLDELRFHAQAILDLPDVEQDVQHYFAERDAARERCFFCDKLLQGDDYSTEFGVYLACTKDWKLFGNPDEFG